MPTADTAIASPLLQDVPPPQTAAANSKAHSSGDIKEIGGEHKGKERQEVDPTKETPSTIVPGESSPARASTDDYVHTGISPMREDIEAMCRQCMLPGMGRPFPTSTAG